MVPINVRLFLSILTTLALVSGHAAAEFPREHIEFFETSVRPILAESCVDCHGTQRAEAGLRLDTREGLLKGGDFGAVVKAGAPQESSLITMIRHEGEEEGLKNMPENGEKLPQDAIAALTRWVELGVPWPDESAYARIEAKTDLTDHWSYKPLSVTDVPADAGHPIDWFTEQKRAEVGLTAAPQADRETLLRRAYFNLKGLPPTAEAVTKFQEAESADAWEQLIDKLLASPHYGERWARYWMDVARYSDVKGYEAGGRERRFVYAYTYRNWLIQALNEDLPYDQFVLLQLAADQLTDAHSKEDLAAMGFLTLARNGRSELIIDDRIDTTFRGLMALTVSCARCHDHKFDPIPTRDYYSLYGIFNNSVAPSEPPQIAEPNDTPEYRAYVKKKAELEQAVQDFLKPKLAEAAVKFPELAQRPSQLERKLERPDSRKLGELRKKVAIYVASQMMEPDHALILEDRPSPATARVFVRGNRANLGETVEPRFLSVIEGEDAEPYSQGSGRLEMAHSIVAPQNPLTARTIVNRVWMHHFGEGIVRTPSDFGHQGEEPTHPELLDWMAHWFMENGWSLKKLHTLILTSETWKQSADHPEPELVALKDPENRLLTRSNRRRLDFETMRDSLLLASRELDTEMFGRTVEIEKAPFPKRRSVYAFINRQNLPTVFTTFDFASPQAHVPKRPYTTIPTQALFTMNHPFMHQQSRRAVINAGLGELEPNERVQRLYQQILGRDATEQEVSMSRQFVSAQVEQMQAHPWRNDPQNTTAWQYGYGRADPETSVIEFVPFEYFRENRWQPRETYPIQEEGLGHLHFHESGGHPGSRLELPAMVRWTADADMTVNIAGRLERKSEHSDAVRGKIFRNGADLLLEAVCEPASHVETHLVDVSVKKGDTIDFVVDTYQNQNHDSFHWAPHIAHTHNPRLKWDYTEDFTGPMKLATPWEMLAQALMSTNEFMFVD